MFCRFLSPPDIINKYGAEHAATIKMDALKSMEGRIAFIQSRGEDTTFMENVLKNLKSIDGSILPQKVDITV